MAKSHKTRQAFKRRIHNFKTSFFFPSFFLRVSHHPDILGRFHPPEVDRLGRQQPVALGRVRQRQQLERALRFRLGKVVLVDLRFALNVREGAPQHEKVHRQRARRLRLQDQLIVDVPLARLVRIALALVDDGLHDPLVVEGGEARRLVVQTVHVLVRTVWLHLEICFCWGRGWEEK